MGEKNAKKRWILKNLPYDEMEGILVKWFNKARDVYVLVKGTILSEKTQEIAVTLTGLKVFTTSNG